MGRATLFASPIDRAIQSQATVAERALHIALDACNSMGRSSDYAPAYVSRVRRDILNALGAVSKIRRVKPRYDMNDIDFQPTAPYERPLDPVIEDENDETAAPPIEVVNDGT